METRLFALLSPFTADKQRVVAVQADQFPVRAPLHWQDVTRVTPPVQDGDLTDDDGATFHHPDEPEAKKSRFVPHPESEAKPDHAAAEAAHADPEPAPLLAPAVGETHSTEG